MKPKNTSNDALTLLVYTSMINAELSRDAVTLNATTTQILGEANKNNQSLALTGALYYGHQHFFQCIEGPADSVKDLFDKIKTDDRHEQVRLLSQHNIKARLFAAWEMKFVHSQDEIINFFADLGHDFFLPEALNQSQLQNFLHLLQKI